jgi:hypothetical protein
LFPFNNVLKSVAVRRSDSIIGRVASPDRAFGYNIAGAMLGGLAEKLSMLIDFQSLVLVAAAF